MKETSALLRLTALLLVLASGNSIRAQGTAFTYQGSLAAGSGPANGNYDLQFAVFDSATNGNAIGVPLTNAATPVSNGLFTVLLDFGSNVFTGPGRWLEISVRTNGGSESFATLSPRQALSATPYAVMAGGLSGTISATQLAGIIPVANGGTGQTGTGSALLALGGVSNGTNGQPNLAAGLCYTNDAPQGVGQQVLAVTVGQSYWYSPSDLTGFGILEIIGTNVDDPGSYYVDPSGLNLYGEPEQTNQIFTATQPQVTFISAVAFAGPVRDSLRPLGGGTNLNVLNLVVSNIIIHGGTATSLTAYGSITGSATGMLSGNAQGGGAGGITNLDSMIRNVRDYNGVLTNAIAGFQTGPIVVYNPTNPGAGNIQLTSLYAPIQASFGENFRIQGNGSSISTINAIGITGTNVLDQYSAPFGARAIDLRGIALSGFYAPGNVGYVAPAACYGTMLWDDVSLDNFVVGACVTSSDGRFEAINLNNDNIGFIVGPYADDSRIDVERVFGCTNAGVELVSRSDDVYGDLEGANIGIVIGGGGYDRIMAETEGATNCAVSIGYPSNWPFTTTNSSPTTSQYLGTQIGNWMSIGPVTAGFSYSLNYNHDYANQFSYSNGAYAKVFSYAPFGGLDLRLIGLNGAPAVISYTAAGDTAPYWMNFVTVGPTNLLVFSDGTSIPSQDGYQVTVNYPEHDFTHNTLEFARETNGDVTAAGTMTAAMVQVQGPLATAITNYSTNVTAANSDSTILLNGNSQTVTLPDATSNCTGRIYTIKLVANSTAVVSTTNLQQIDGASSYTLSAQYKYVTVQSDGTQWWIIANN